MGSDPWQTCEGWPEPRESVGVGVGGSGSVADHEVEVLEREEPLRHPGVGVFSPGHPLKGRVVRDEGELPTQQVIPQLQDCPLYRQSLFLDGSVAPLSLRQLPADEQDRVFLTFLYLGQDGS